MCNIDSPCSWLSVWTGLKPSTRFKAINKCLGRSRAIIMGVETSLWQFQIPHPPSPPSPAPFPCTHSKLPLFKQTMYKPHPLVEGLANSPSTASFFYTKLQITRNLICQERPQQKRKWACKTAENVTPRKQDKLGEKIQTLKRKSI